MIVLSFLEVKSKPDKKMYEVSLKWLLVTTVHVNPNPIHSLHEIFIDFHQI